MRINFIVMVSIFISGLFGANNNMFTPVDIPKDLNTKKVLLGKALFTDKSLSIDGTISCASCHDGINFGVDNAKTSTGIKNQKGAINAPTTFNARFHFAQFHDGRAKDLKEQAKGPMTNPIEMGNNEKNIIQAVSKNNYYKFYFGNLYKDGITIDNIADAIAEFEKALVSPSRFDDYLKGDIKALRDIEIAGLELFKSYGCVACHNGINIGGNLFAKLGVSKEYKGSSLGRYNVTKDEADKNHFRVPTLRNINWTAPYLHDGTIKELDKCIEFMGEYQLGIKLPKEDIRKIESYLHSLTGKVPDVTKD